MITKHDLKEYRSLKDDIVQLEWDIAEMRSINESIQAQQLTGMPTAHNATSKLETDVIKVLEREEHYANLIAEFIHRRRVIDEHVDRLPQTERQLIKYKYIQGNTWEKVCVLMNYSWKQVHRIHGQALKDLANMTLNDTIKSDTI